MHDVAARAGVSHQTVSRVINEFQGIRPATRERVLAAIEELGYHRNLSARALVTGRTHTIGMIGPLIPDIGPLSTLHAIERSARGVGLHTLMTSADANAESATEAVGFLLGRGVDGIALVAQQQAIADAVGDMRLSVPVIHLLTGGEPRGEAASIDQRAGVRLALEHLIDLGHTRIQHVSGPPTYTESQLRKDEYLSVVAERELAPLEVLDGDWTADAGYAAGGRLDPTATAVFCANDQMAFGLIHALADAGRTVPGDISVVGFDDTSEARHSLPPLTTVRQDFVAVGHLAVDLIVQAFDGADTSGTQQLVPELVVRQTTSHPQS
ncbi:LacI family DNA-binding transcriptional regulator [Demequina sp. SO4-18]|uniref:LacI family DNA-binding transcriptional regulator n=1 Tax=Demequina sp. SO4-18 TaxID=3401026 RepID=UPI003B5BDB9B